MNHYFIYNCETIYIMQSSIHSCLTLIVTQWPPNLNASRNNPRDLASFTYAISKLPCTYLVPCFKTSLRSNMSWFAWNWTNRRNSFSHIDSLWHRGKNQLGNSLFYVTLKGGWSYDYLAIAFSYLSSGTGDNKFLLLIPTLILGVVSGRWNPTLQMGRISLRRMHVQ